MNIALQIEILTTIFCIISFECKIFTTGHRSLVRMDWIRVLEESLRREPVYILNVSFKMPQDNCQLKTIRREIRDVADENLILLKVDSTVPRVHPRVTESFVGFAKAVKVSGKEGTYSIANIC